MSREPRRQDIELRIVARFGVRVGGTCCQLEVARKLQAATQRKLTGFRALIALAA
jgi:hypothetical protein